MSEKTKLSWCILMGLLTMCSEASMRFFDFETSEDCVLSPSKDDETGIRGLSDEFATSGRRSLRLGTTDENSAKVGYAVVEVARPSGALPDLSGYDRLVFDAVNLDDDAKSIPVYPVVGSGRVRAARTVHGLQPFVLTQVVVDLSVWRKADVDMRDVRGLSIAIADATGSFVHFDNFVLLAKGEALPVRSKTAEDLNARLAGLAEESRQRRAAKEAARQQREIQAQRENLAAFVARTPGLPRTERMIVAKATAMDQIRPRNTDFARLSAPEDLTVRLARGEYESAQLAVMSDKDTRLSRVRMTTKGFPFEVKCRVVGYVNAKYPTAHMQAYCEKSSKPCGYERKTRMTPLGWYADPILDFLDSADVEPGVVQGFLVTVKAPRDQKRGVYKGVVVLSAEGEGEIEIPLSVRVYGFETPLTSPLPLLVNFTPFVQPRSLSWTAEQADELRKDREAPVNLWRRRREEWADWLAEYFIGPGTVYSPMKQADVPDLDLIVREQKRGRLGHFVFGSWNNGETDWESRIKPILRHRYEQVKAAGLLDKAVLYAYDETVPKFFPAISNAAERCKREFPDVPLSTTAYDDNCGVGTILSGVDWFTPVSTKYSTDIAAKARKEGRQVWWYVACGERAPLANFFVENPLSDARQLMGAQAVRMKPDGFLYYAVAKWNQRRPIVSGPFTDWSPVGIRHVGGRAYDGDGVWIYCGPDGVPVPTLRLENFRDGIEDYSYATTLAGLVEKHGDDAWSREARKLLAVPETVMVSIKEFTDDAAAIYAWRDRMAELIERGLE